MNATLHRIADPDPQGADRHSQGSAQPDRAVLAGRAAIAAVRLCSDIRSRTKCRTRCSMQIAAAHRETSSRSSMARAFSSASSTCTMRSQIADVIGRKQALLVIHMPADFERRFASGQGAVVQVITDGRNSNTGDVAAGYVGAVVDRFNAAWSSAHGVRARRSRSKRAPGTTRISKRAGT